MTEGRQRGMHCLDAESLAAYVDGRLTPEERAKAEAHLASCEACYDALVETTRLLGEIESDVDAVHHPVRSDGEHSRGGSRSPNRTVLPLLAAAAALIVVIGAWWATREGPLDRAVAALADASRGTRFSEGRVSLDREWRPAAPVLRAPEGESASLEVRSAAFTITGLTDADESGTGLHARGLALLASGNVEASVDALERTIAAGGVDEAIVRADLAAARLERFRRTGNISDPSRAIADADRALSLSPRALPALFNRAAALDASGDREKAAAAWLAYLDADPSSAWSAEARRRLVR